MTANEYEDELYAGLSPFTTDDTEEPKQDDLPLELEPEVRRLAAIALEQLIPNPKPATTYAAGIGPGLLRQSIEEQIKRYWFEHHSLPSGLFKIDGRKAVRLPGAEG